MCRYIRTMKNESQADSQGTSYITTQKISLVAVDVLTLLSRMAFDINDESTQSKAEAYLKRADRVCQLTRSSDGWRWVSSAYHNIGGALYKQGLFERAIGSLLKSCELLAECLDRWDIKSSAGGLDDELGELRSQLCKRYEVLGISFQKTGELEVCIRDFSPEEFNWCWEEFFTGNENLVCSNVYIFIYMINLKYRMQSNL